ncbi:uncharacterized protein LOC113144426 [Mastacembelus armatus]|uniref:Uncharacterized LOC113144073 n=1 Tax=Mastacembelus armatus TaxID=205130 RepID=A0A3Q3N5S5_9TELE|nr:uncharacterized protein LOC113144426 [Mastacembelus armatus]
MIGRLAAFILLSTLSQTQDIPQQISVIVTEPGDNVTLTCPIFGDKAGLFYWYKLNFGHMVQTVATGTFDKIALTGQFDNSRFSVTRTDAQYHLTIRTVSKEDEATYFCQAGSAYTMGFTNGTVLTVNDHKNLQKTVYVKQTPETESVQLGDSVTLQCSLVSKNKENSVQCPGEHNVHWFRPGSGRFGPGVIYTHRNRSNEQEERSCVYSWSKTIQDSSDAGTYYCAVVTCGQILFGEGTKVDTRQRMWPFGIALGILLAFCVTVTTALIHSIKRKPVCKHCKGEAGASRHAEHDRSAQEQATNLNGETGAPNYVVLDFPSRQPKRWKNNRESSLESTYSTIKECH